MRELRTSGSVGGARRVTAGAYPTASFGVWQPGEETRFVACRRGCVVASFDCSTCAGAASAKWVVRRAKAGA